MEPVSLQKGSNESMPGNDSARILPFVADFLKIIRNFLPRKQMYASDIAGKKLNF
jgi:hypothetical protein